MEKILVKDWMTSPAITITPDAHLADAYKLLKERNIRRLPVVEKSKLVGIVTLGDIRRLSPLGTPKMLEQDHTIAQTTVSRVMTTNVMTIPFDATLSEAASVLLDLKIGGLPVVDDDDELVGMITEADLFHCLMLEIERAQEG